MTTTGEAVATAAMIGAAAGTAGALAVPVSLPRGAAS